MDDTTNKSLSIEEATCLTFGYDRDILITEKIEDYFSQANIENMAKNFANPKNDPRGFEAALKRCISPYALESGEAEILTEIYQLRDQIMKADKISGNLLENQPDSMKMPLGSLVTRYLGYLSLKYDKEVAGGQSNLVFGNEYALLNLNAKDATIGLREITEKSICADVNKMVQIEHLKKIDEHYILEYTAKFMHKHHFQVTEALIKLAWKRIKEFKPYTRKDIVEVAVKDGNSGEKKALDKNVTKDDSKTKKKKKVTLGKSLSTDNLSQAPTDVDIKKLKKFSTSDLTSANIAKINKCKNICVQNMALSGQDITKLGDDEVNTFKQLCFMYTGDLCKLLNGYFRNNLLPVYAWEEKLIKKYKELQHVLVFYSNSGFGDIIILPYEVYKQIKDSAELLVKHLNKHYLSAGSECWRLMDIAGLHAMLNEEVTEKNDHEIKEELRDATKRNKLYKDYDAKLKNKKLLAQSFLSTSLNSNGVLYINDVDNKSIVMKITPENAAQGVCLDNYTPDKYKGMREFLFNKDSKFTIQSVSHYTGKQNISALNNKCLQINCTC